MKFKNITIEQFFFVVQEAIKNVDIRYNREIETFVKLKENLEEENKKILKQFFIKERGKIRIFALNKKKVKEKAKRIKKNYYLKDTLEIKISEDYMYKLFKLKEEFSNLYAIKYIESMGKSNVPILIDIDPTDKLYKWFRK